MRFSRLGLLPILSVSLACASTTDPIPSSWLSVPRATVIRSVALGADGKVTTGSEPEARTGAKGSIRAMGSVIVNADRPLVRDLEAIDSLDLSESRGEVAFSVKRPGQDDFDIGLVAVEGSDISWIPDDPSDDVMVQWAPRGNKISYVIRARFGDIVRTLHIPTAFSFGVDFPFSRVRAVGWDPQAERYAVVYSSPVASDAVDVLRYSGEQRTAAVRPAASVEGEIQPFAGDAILIQPRDILYNERLPVVIWVDPDRLVWNDARGELLRGARVALIVTSTPPDAALLDRVRGTAVLDASRMFTVNASVPGATAILPDPGLPAARFARRDGAVLAPPAVIESFAARFIAGQLKRNPPPNGNR